MRVANLPASCAEHAPASCHQLPVMIAETYGLNAYHVHMARDWLKRDGARAWAFLEVADESKGDYLIRDIGGTIIHNAQLDLPFARACSLSRKNTTSYGPLSPNTRKH